MNGGVPDLGTLAKPQAIQVGASVLARSVAGIPLELVDATGLVAMIRAEMREIVHEELQMAVGAVHDDLRALLGGLLNEAPNA